MNKNLTIISLLGVVTIILGAFGSHSLKEMLTTEGVKSFETAVEYQMYHLIVLLFVNGFNMFSSNQKNIISYLFFIGIFFFSGSIYLIQLTSVTAKSIWFITPLGGFLFILGWSYMAFSFFTMKPKNGCR